MNLDRHPKILLIEDDINRINKEIAKTILKEHQLDENDVFVCLLTGGTFFFADIVRELYRQNSHSAQINIALIKTKTYVSNGQVADSVVFEYNGLMDLDLENKRVWLVDDICDSGKTMNAVVDWLRKDCKFKGDINIVTFGVRENHGFMQISEIKSFYTGEIFKKGDWLVGYGLDDNGQKRNLPYISTYENEYNI